MGREDRISQADSFRVDQLLRVHARSLSLAARHRHERMARCGSTDTRQCRIRLDAAQRQIDRLRRGVDRVTLNQPPRAGLLETVEAEPPRASLADPPPPQRASAVRALGRPSPRPHAPPPLVIEHLPLVNYTTVTNLGTLMDLLA